MTVKLTDAQVAMLKDGEPDFFGGVRVRPTHGRSLAAFRRKGWADEGFHLTPEGIEIYNEVTGGNE